MTGDVGVFVTIVVCVRIFAVLANILAGVSHRYIHANARALPENKLRVSTPVCTQLVLSLPILFAVTVNCTLETAHVCEVTNKEPRC
jgi:hypothetical protein